VGRISRGPRGNLASAAVSPTLLGQRVNGRSGNKPADTNKEREVLLSKEKFCAGSFTCMQIAGSEDRVCTYCTVQEVSPFFLGRLVRFVVGVNARLVRGAWARSGRVAQR